MEGMSSVRASEGYPGTGTQDGVHREAIMRGRGGYGGRVPGFRLENVGDKGKGEPSLCSSLA